ncbi:NADH:flavin oxidoreductase [Proteinivorax hydrogeniformans]|uniref:NADH:flavin oxidoreductase n=1 Tax=Proteinivorax hydrogeniformans TaxID=1826727 RepID=A0AAU8HQT0_9FIRM
MKNLLSLLDTRNLSLHNRLVYPPMATTKADVDGALTQEILDFYKEKSEGGYIGLIVTEHAFITQKGKAHERQLSISKDEDIEGMRKLADVLRGNGCKSVAQINHAGGKAKKDVTGYTPVAPSADSEHLKGEVHQLSLDEISDIVSEFADAALRVKKAGFDGVQIHSAHSYLLNQFFSPLTNKRKDKYGGDLNNRIRIHLEVIEAVRKAVGEDFHVQIRLGASDFEEGGTTIEHSKVAAKEFERAGVDIIDISGGVNGYNISGLKGQGFFAPLTEAIKEVVNVPVVLTGGITDLLAAEELLKEDKADLIGVGRAIYKDSTWAKRAFDKLNG